MPRRGAGDRRRPPRPDRNSGADPGAWRRLKRFAFYLTHDKSEFAQFLGRILSQDRRKPLVIHLSQLPCESGATVRHLMRAGRWRWSDRHRLGPTGTVLEWDRPPSIQGPERIPAQQVRMTSMGARPFSPLRGWMAPAPGVAMRHYGVVICPQAKEPSMGEITTIGFDLAKSVLQVHAVGVDGKTVLRRQLRRSQMQACFCQALALPDRHGGLCRCAFLGAGTGRSRARAAADAAMLCQTLRQARQDRCDRRRSDLRSGDGVTR